MTSWFGQVTVFICNSAGCVGGSPQPTGKTAFQGGDLEAGVSLAGVCMVPAGGWEKRVDLRHTIASPLH